MTSASPQVHHDAGRMSFHEFVSFVAACLALNALAIDVMLPALPDIDASFLLTDPNRSQAVVAVYLIGMGLSQLFHGPLSDRFGRRPTLIFGLLVFSVAGSMAALANSFALLLVARVAQGVGSGAPRVIGVALARDYYSGADLGRVMSLAMMVFMTVPILAPSVGQLILLIAPWRWAFGALVAGGVALLIWTWSRLRESLPIARRRSITPSAVLASYRIVVGNRSTLAYTLALGLVRGGLMAFIISSQQIFSNVFHAEKFFGPLFATAALTMSAASFANSRLVMRYRMHRLVLIGLTAMILSNALNLGAIWDARESLPAFLFTQAATMFTFGMLGANLNTLAMEPLAEVAGAGSSFIGFFTTVCGALIGYLVGQMFDGSVLPLTASYVILGLAALAIVLFTEPDDGTEPAKVAA